MLLSDWYNAGASDDELDFLSGFSNTPPEETGGDFDYQPSGRSQLDDFYSDLSRADDFGASADDLRAFYGDLIIPLEEADPDQLRGRVFSELVDALNYISEGGIETISRIAFSVVGSYYNEDTDEEEFEYEYRVEVDDDSV